MSNFYRCCKGFSGVLWISVGLFLATFASCRTPQNVVLLKDLKDTTIQATHVDLEPVIQKNDLLSITVSSLNPEASMIFNAPIASAAAANSATGPSTSTGYLVNQEGFIQFPILGNVKAAGLTRKQLTEELVKSLLDRKLLVDPIVNIRFLNFRVTILGEVARPTVVTVPHEKISILEAIGLAGDLTIYARRENVLVIREEGGSKVIKRLDLNSPEIFNSPYYYLKSNDIVYAEPNKSKITQASNTRQILPLVISSLSLVAVIVTRLIN
jgi:polysaccharide export outer membrane protein